MLITTYTPCSHNIYAMHSQGHGDDGAHCSTAGARQPGLRLLYAGIHGTLPQEKVRTCRRCLRRGEAPLLQQFGDKDIKLLRGYIHHVIYLGAWVKQQESEQRLKAIKVSKTPCSCLVVCKFRL
jgi:hypothetical protein